MASAAGSRRQGRGIVEQQDRDLASRRVQTSIRAASSINLVSARQARMARQGIAAMRHRQCRRWRARQARQCWHRRPAATKALALVAAPAPDECQRVGAGVRRQGRVERCRGISGAGADQEPDWTCGAGSRWRSFKRRGEDSPAARNKSCGEQSATRKCSALRPTRTWQSAQDDDSQGEHTPGEVAGGFLDSR